MTILNPSILIVEDSPTMQRLLIAHLDNYVTDIKYEKYIFSHGVSAKNFIETNGNDLVMIIADIMLPGMMSGIDLLTYVRKDQRFYSIPFLIITANTDTTVKYISKSLNCNGFLYKPFTANQLYGLLDTWLKQKY